MKLAENQQVFKEGIIVFPEQAGQDPYIAASKCPQCGKVYFPKKDFCPACMLDDGMRDIALSPEGVLYTFSVVHLGVSGFKTPYVLGWVEFPQEKVRIAAQIEYDPAKALSELKPGQKVRLAVGKLREIEGGREIIGYRYKPV
jgi:uncharacterized OB-fold protein